MSWLGRRNVSFKKGVLKENNKPAFQLLTIKQIAGFLQISEKTVYRWIEEGKLKAFRFPGKAIRVDPKDFEEFLVSYYDPE